LQVLLLLLEPLLLGEAKAPELLAPVLAVFSSLN